MRTRVLLVEDEPDIRLIARAALARGGFQVETAADGDAALESVAAARPDAIVLDWMLPTLDGFEVCARLKADAATRAIPIVFLTARSNEADRDRCLSLGAIGCIPKPFNPLTLARDLRALLDATSAGRAPSCG